MKYVRKFATRRELADAERLMDLYNWFILKSIGSTAPPGFVEVTTPGPTRNSYTNLSDITDDVLATTNIDVVYFKAGGNYYRKIPNHMLWCVDSYKKDDGTTPSPAVPVVGYYMPMAIQIEGDFTLPEFNSDFLIPVMDGEWIWTSLGSTAPTGYTFTNGQDTCDNINEVTPAVQDDYPYMKVGSTYYRKDAAPSS